jgi:hypothetical protein
MNIWLQGHISCWRHCFLVSDTKYWGTSFYVLFTRRQITAIEYSQLEPLYSFLAREVMPLLVHNSLDLLLGVPSFTLAVYFETVEWKSWHLGRSPTLHTASRIYAPHWTKCRYSQRRSIGNVRAKYPEVKAACSLESSGHLSQTKRRISEGSNVHT